MHAKKIRVQGEQGKVVPVHTDCLKQIEMSRDLQKVAQTAPKPKEVSTKRERPQSLEMLEQMTRGFTETKRMFLAVSLEK